MKCQEYILTLRFRPNSYLEEGEQKVLNRINKDISSVLECKSAS